MEATSPRVYEFGQFRLDPAKRLLRRLDGTTVALTPRVFETLLFMVEHHDTVLDKERLMEAVWPDSIVEENNLSQNISTLRRIFGETPGSHNYIVTVPGRGYRFVAEVSERTGNGIATVEADQETRPTSPEHQTESATAKGQQRFPGKTGRPLVVAVLGVIVLAAGFLARGPTVRWLEKHRIASASPTPSSGTVAERVRSIAVLPFEPLGQDMNDELLGLGMTDAVIGRMSNLKQLVVLPTSAVSKYKGPASDPLAAGRALHVDAILSGTIQRSGDQVRATVQLAHVASGRTLWSEKFDQTFTNIFGIQDSISDSVVRSLALSLTTDEQKHLGKHYTTNVAAYDSYLMGLYFWNKRSKEGLEKAIDYFGRAVEKDPNFALAYALMADCYFLQFSYGYDLQPDRIQNAETAAKRALLLDDSIAESHLAASHFQLYQKDYHAGMESLRRALALNPNLAIAHARYAWALCSFGHLDEAVREMKRAQELDPLSATNSATLGLLLIFARQYNGALAYCSRAAELEPDDYIVRCTLATAYRLNGMFQQAIDQYRRAGDLNVERKGDVLASIATVLTSAGRKAEADAMMPEILELAAGGKADPYDVAVLCAARGDREQGFKWLAKALANPRLASGIVRYDPLLDPLRSDGRFVALLQQHKRAWRLETAASP
jgi:DNA-binding winged helix-turn-helix (wHTH) protein/TolB-like protein/tetratricopeptide (TPR) repeat protein